jgi:hypothetical protein
MKKKTHGFVYVAIAYKLTGSNRSNKVFIEVFKKKEDADMWRDQLSYDDFHCQINKHIVR